MAELIDLIGDTPLVEIKYLNPNPDVKIYGKLEGNNPGGSIKDRTALAMIQNAMKRGDIKKGVKWIEATSGNTGIALAMLGAFYQYEVELVMPSSSTRERVLSMEAFGAQVTLLDGIEACRDYADEKGKKDGFYQFNQFANPDNIEAHYGSTGPEIWNQTNGKITHFVSAMGTTGTIIGVSKYLKQQNPGIQVVGCQPSEGSNIPGIRRWPKEYMPKIFDARYVDKTVDVSGQEAAEMARQMAKTEGISVGVSSGGQAHAALKIAQKLDSGIIVFICCDRGDRYLSSGVFG